MRTARAVAALLLTLSLAAAQENEALRDRASVSYAVDASSAALGKVRVTMTVENLREDDVKVAVPAWAPGAYRLVDYHMGIAGISAAGGGKPLSVRRVDERTWSVAAGGASPFTITYTVITPDSGRGGISKDHCDLQGPATYLYVVGRTDLPCSASFNLPEGWKIATGLERRGDLYRARDYDTFADCPVELGKFELREFECGGAKFEVVVHAAGKVDLDGLAQLCRTIVAEQEKLFGGFPFKRFVFLYHFRHKSGGGLEHLNSTSIAMQHIYVRRDIRAVAGITSHEFHHVWNVKRLRPRELGPFDYSRPARTRALWFCEGFTSYYGDLTLARAGIWDRERYLKHLADEINTLQNNPDRLKTSAEKASWTVWDPRDEMRISYYNKGELLALLLDLKIRHLTRSQKSLDDVMRHLYDKFVVKGGGPIGVGFADGDIEKAVREASGHDFSRFFDDYIRGVGELPYEEYLLHAGLETEIQMADFPSLGFYFFGNYAAYPVPEIESPLKSGDRVVLLNGERVFSRNLRDEVQKLKIGSEAALTVLRGKERIELAMKVGRHTRARCILKWIAQPDELQKKIRESWLGPSKGKGDDAKESGRRFY